MEEEDGSPPRRVRQRTEPSGSGVSGSQPPDEPQPNNATISLDLTAEFESLFDSETLSDVTLIIPRSTGGAGSDERSERRFCLHKVILASSATYFRSLFTTGMKEGKENEVVLHGIDPDLCGGRPPPALRAEPRR